MHTILVLSAIVIILLIFLIVYRDMLRLDSFLTAKRLSQPLTSGQKQIPIRISADCKETVRNAQPVLEACKAAIPQIDILMEVHRPDQIQKQLRAETIELALIRPQAEVVLSSSETSSAGGQTLRSGQIVPTQKAPVQFFRIPGNEQFPLLAWNPNAEFPMRDKLLDVIIKEYCTSRHGYADYLIK